MIGDRMIEEFAELYSNFILETGSDGISFGFGGIELCPPTAIQDWQIGYSRTEDGRSLVDEYAPGRWRSTWIVIARETALGDPIFSDARTPHPVITAMHGEGAWEPKTIATSLKSFFYCLAELQRLSVGRVSPVELEANPISTEERRKFLATIEAINTGSIFVDFWDIQIGFEEVPGSEGFFSPRWSPDGRYVAALMLGQTNLMLFDFQKQTWRAIPGTENIGWPHWSKDGNTIFYLAYAATDSIRRVRISDDSIEVVHDNKEFSPTGIWGDSPTLAPDDSPLLLRNTGTHDVYSLDVKEP